MLQRGRPEHRPATGRHFAHLVLAVIALLLALSGALASPVPGSAATVSDDDLLHRKALAIGLDRALDHPVEPAVLRKVLVEQMRLLLSRPDPRERVTEEEIRKHYRDHAERFRSPGRISLRQVFISASRDRARDKAERLLASLRSGKVAARHLAALSDPFPVELELRLVSEEHLARRFGPGFASALSGLPIRRWSGPIRSSQGLHLVRIDERRPPGSAPLSTVRKTIVAAIFQERASRKLAEALRRMRAEGDVNPD